MANPSTITGIQYHCHPPKVGAVERHIERADGYRRDDEPVEQGEYPADVGREAGHTLEQHPEIVADLLRPHTEPEKNIEGSVRLGEDDADAVHEEGVGE